MHQPYSAKKTTKSEKNAIFFFFFLRASETLDLVSCISPYRLDRKEAKGSPYQIEAERAVTSAQMR